MVSRIYQLFYWELFRYMESRTESAAEAEDVVQETFLRALEHRGLLEAMDDAKRRAWLYRTAKNLLIDRIRWKKAEPVFEELEGWKDDLSVAQVAELCNLLKPRERAMFRMRYFEGYHAGEIGKAFGVSSSTVRDCLAVARNKLREYYPELKRKGGE